MNDEKQEYILYRLKRSYESLQEAELLIQHNHLHTAVNRLYYACFYAVTALLLTQGLSSSKHSGVRLLFDQHWIKNGRLPSEMGLFYRNLYNLRQRSDYTDLIMFQKTDVQSHLQQTFDFVNSISTMIKE